MGNSNFLKMHFNLLKIFVTLCMITFMGFGCSSSSSNAPPDTGEEQILDITGADTVIDIIEVGECPWGVAAKTDGSYVYVTNEKEDTVSVIDTEHNTVEDSIPVGESPRGVAVARREVTPGTYVEYAYVANYSNDNVSVIDTSDNTFVTDPSDPNEPLKIPVGNGPQWIAASPDGNYVYVTNFMDDTVSVIDTSLDPPEEIVTVNVGKQPTGIAVAPLDGSRVYVANKKANGSTDADDTVSVINTENPSAPVVITEVTVGNAPKGIAISLDGSYVYVANNSDRTTDDGYDSVSIITTLDNSVETIESITKRPEGIAVTPDNFVYVTNWGNRSVSVISALSNIYEGTIQMEYDSSLPIGIAVAVMPDGESYFVYVANNSAEANTVTVLGWP